MLLETAVPKKVEGYRGGCYYGRRTAKGAETLGAAKEDIVKKYFVTLLMASLVLAECGRKKEETPGEVASPAESTPKPERPAEKALPMKMAGRVLLVTQSQFKPDDKGLYTVPDEATMWILKPGETEWAREKITDKESNVFHKALPYGKEGILTLGGNAAMLKLWHQEGDGWKAEALWSPTFGGKQNRLRDFEMADFNGDGAEDLAIATHDQGVIAVVWRKGDKWEPEELDRAADTFVHEIEIGDLDKDGKLEIYATPSKPNTVSGKDQGGEIVRFAWNGEKFEKSVVVSLETRHVKEILVTDLDGDGKDELYAAVEAETDGPTIKAPVEIRRFDLEGKTFKETLVTQIDDRFCRFLVAGDLTGDGKKELIAAAFSAGVFVITPDGDGYKKESINAKSGGFEHAAYIADIDNDGKMELYVANDKAGTIERYDYKDGKYGTQVIDKRRVPSQAMAWNITTADL